MANCAVKKNNPAQDRYKIIRWMIGLPPHPANRRKTGNISIVYRTIETSGCGDPIRARKNSIMQAA